MTTLVTEKPIMYLDIDDTLVCWTKNPRIAPGATEFLIWADEHFEIRWLTMWAPEGFIRLEAAKRLSIWFDLPVEFFREHRNPLEFWALKTEAIDWKAHEEGRKWVWLEDDIYVQERKALRDRRAGKHWIPTWVTKNPNRLIAVWNELGNQFNLEIPQKFRLDKKVKV